MQRSGFSHPLAAKGANTLLAKGAHIAVEMMEGPPPGPSVFYFSFSSAGWVGLVFSF